MNATPMATTAAIPASATTQPQSPIGPVGSTTRRIGAVRIGRRIACKPATWAVRSTDTPVLRNLLGGILLRGLDEHGAQLSQEGADSFSGFQIAGFHAASIIPSGTPPPGAGA